MDDLERKSWLELIQMRAQAPQEMQGLLAPYEHRAYAREDIAERPWLALAYLLMVPGYQALKAVRGGARTNPSLEQVKQGYIGVGEGLQYALRGLLDPE